VEARIGCIQVGKNANHDSKKLNKCLLHKANDTNVVLTKEKRRKSSKQHYTKQMTEVGQNERTRNGENNRTRTSKK
jgi:hypothetical protein